MIPTSTARIVIPSLVAVAAGGAALAFGITQAWRPLPVETRAEAASPAAILPPASIASSDSGAKDLGAKNLGTKDSGVKDSGVKDEAIAALAPAQTEANAAATQLAAVSPPLSIIDKSVPVFDIARIEPTGDAVIAGSAAPGAVVELLRNGERHDQAVADQSGNFVMVPPRLPPGTYELTLRAKMPDGTIGVSQQRVAVALNEVEPTSSPLRSHAEAPSNTPGATTVTNQPRQDVAVSQPEATATIPPPRAGSSPAATEPKTTTTTVSRGDSLWRISRLTYGDGTRYALVYRANRDRIRDPNRIYPGQTFVLPLKSR
jgi:nucleoid-associated protein YgaU